MTLAAQVERASRDCREVEDLREALAVAVSALRAAEGELSTIERMPMPLDDRIEKALVDYEVMKAILQRLRRNGRGSTLPDLTELRAKEKKRLAGSHLTSEGCMPVLPEVTAALASAREQLRRLRALSPAVRDVLDEGGWE